MGLAQQAADVRQAGLGGPTVMGDGSFGQPACLGISARGEIRPVVGGQGNGGAGGQDVSQHDRNVSAAMGLGHELAQSALRLGQIDLSCSGVADVVASEMGQDIAGLGVAFGDLQANIGRRGGLPAEALEIAATATGQFVAQGASARKLLESAGQIAQHVTGQRPHLVEPLIGLPPGGLGAEIESGHHCDGDDQSDRHRG